MTNEAPDKPVLSVADRALLGATVSPSDDQLAATRRAIGARIAALAAGTAVAHAASSAQATGTAAAATAAASTAPVATGATTGLAALGAGKWIAAGLIVTAIASGAVVATRQPRNVDRQPLTRASTVAQTTRAARPASAPVAVAPPAHTLAPADQPSQPAKPTRAVTAKRSERRASSEPGSARDSDGGTLAGELTLLHGARQALARGDASAALQALDAHAARYPNAMLRQEALSARALALCEAGRTAEARRTAAQLARIAPRSPHLIRLADSCALDGTPDSKE